MNHKKVLLVDSFGLLFRSYFALERTGLATKSGMATFAIYGFFRAFFKAVQEINPTDIVFALESKTSLRKHLDPNYKANRKEQPQTLLEQIKLFHDILERTQLPAISLEGYEADDVLSTLTEFYKQKGKTEVYIYTSDKDIAQLVGDRVVLVQPSKVISQPLQLLNDQGVIDKFGVSPAQMKDYLSIVGDVSDNIKGVEGIGPKTASKLLQEYGSLEGILSHLDELTPVIRNKFIASKEALKLSQALVALHQDCSFLKDPHIGVLKKSQIDQLKKIFAELEFAPFKELSYLYNLVQDSDSDSFELFSTHGEVSEHSTSQYYRTFTPAEVTYQMITNLEELQNLKNHILTKGYMCFDTETTGLDLTKDTLLGVSICLEEKKAFYIPLGHKKIEQIAIKDFQEMFQEIFESDRIKKIGHNIKYDYKVLKTIFPHIKGIYFDTMIAAYIIKPDSKKYSLDDLSLELFEYQKITYKSLVDGKEYNNLSSVAIEKVKDYACEDADITYQLFEFLQTQIEKEGLKNIFYTIEMPLVSILAEMELEGIGVDIPYFKNLHEVFKSKLEKIAEEIFEVAGEEINLNSPKQISSLLYDTMKLPKPKSAGRSKSVFATDEESLQDLKEFSVVKNILEYRKYHKLLTTYVNPISIKANYTTKENLPRIHTHFQQTGTATGRLSSTDPNLQNIPVRDEAGLLIRKGFIAKPGYVFISLDYSQIELRLMAHFSSDPSMIQAFREDEDIHTATASKIFAKVSSQVDSRERNIAKIINFGIIYGMGYVKLAKSLNISNAEAKDFIQKYFELFKGVKDFIEQTKEQAHKQEYVTTLLKRKRFLVDINGNNNMLASMNERMAVNTVIQGSNADLLKKCMIEITANKSFTGAKLLLQIHDELVFEVLESEAEIIGKKLRDCMENVYILKVPLKASLNIGLNWGTLKA